MKLKDCIVCGKPRLRKLGLKMNACCSWQCLYVYRRPLARRWHKANRDKVNNYKRQWMAKKRSKVKHDAQAQLSDLSRPQN